MESIPCTELLFQSTFASEKDIWLQSRIRPGNLSIQHLYSDEPCENKFQRISVDLEQVTIYMFPVNSWQSPIEGIPEQRAHLQVPLGNYSRIFGSEDEDLGYIDKMQHKLHVPVTLLHRCIPPTQYKEVKEAHFKIADEGCHTRVCLMATHAATQLHESQF